MNYDTNCYETKMKGARVGTGEAKMEVRDASNAMTHVVIDLVVSILSYATTVRNQGTWRQLPQSQGKQGDEGLWI